VRAEYAYCCDHYRNAFEWHRIEGLHNLRFGHKFRFTEMLYQQLDEFRMRANDGVLEGESASIFVESTTYRNIGFHSKGEVIEEVPHTIPGVIDWFT
jgi:hypothetical protein